MNRCPHCDCLREPGGVCPGCMVQLGLAEPSRRPPWWGVVGLGAVLGLSVLTTVGAGVMFAASRPSSCDHRHLLEEVRAEREALQRARIALEESRAAFEAERTARTPKRSENDLELRALQEEIARARAEAIARAEAAAAARHARAEAEERAAAARQEAREAAEQARIEARLVAKEHRRARLAAMEVDAVELPEPEECGTLPDLESAAMLGKLSKDARLCLEAFRFSDERVARLLMVDAFSVGDIERWYRLGHDFMRAYPPDPDIAYKLALYAGKTGQSADALKWAGIALKYRSAWAGGRYTSRVYSLYKLRYHASMTVYGPTAGQTRFAFVEWDDFANASGRSRPKRPPELAEHVH